MSVKGAIVLSAQRRVPNDVMLRSYSCINNRYSCARLAENAEAIFNGFVWNFPTKILSTRFERPVLDSFFFKPKLMQILSFFSFIQLHSEYRSTYRWHEYTGGSRPDVIRKPPATNQFGKSFCLSSGVRLDAHSINHRECFLTIISVFAFGFLNR